MQNGPMGTLSTYYLFRSMMECVSAVSADYQDNKRVCDLEPGSQTLVMLLSCITVTFARPQCCHYLHHSRLSSHEQRLHRPVVVCLQSWRCSP